jgi:hypothetical protein
MIGLLKIEEALQQIIKWPTPYLRQFHPSAKRQPMPNTTKKHADRLRRRLSAAYTAAKVAIAPLSPQKPQTLFVDAPVAGVEIQQYSSMKDVSGGVLKRLH